MTNREFYNAIAMNEEVALELRTFAEQQLAKLDTKTAAARSKDSEKRAEANAPIIAALRVMLTTEFKTSAELTDMYNSTAELPIKPQKMTAVLRAMVKTGDVISTDIKVAKKGTQKGYKLA